MNEPLLLLLGIIAAIGAAVARWNSARSKKAKRRDDERLTQSLAEPADDPRDDDATSGMVRWWHYTLARTLAEILASGAIKRSTLGVSGGERTAVWFSCRTDWEPTATRGLLDSRTGQRRTATIEEMVAGGGELVRLEVPATVARYTWADHRRLGQIDPRMADTLERALGGEPAKWRLSYDDVPLSQIVNIEASMDGHSWRSVGTGSEFAVLMKRAAKPGVQ